MNNKIPKIIHHIAPKNKERWHPIWDQCYPSWKKQFPDFEHKLWNDEEDIDKLVRTNYPEHWKLYSSFPAHIMKIDFARICILHKYGGIYADMDVFCYKNFYDELPQDFHIVQAPYGEKWMNGELQVENCLMCSTKNNDFVSRLINECETNYIIKVKKKFNKKRMGDNVQSYLIGMTAGPNYVSCAMETHNVDTRSILPGNVFNNHGLSYDKKFFTKHLLTGMWGKESMQLFEGKESMMKKSIEEYSKFVSFSGELDMFRDYTEGNYIR